MLNSREVGIVLEPEVTKLKLINRVGEVWSARSPPPAADALPSSPTLSGKQSCASNCVLQTVPVPHGSCVREADKNFYT